MRNPIVAYLVALVALAVAVYLRWLLIPLLHTSLPTVTLLGAVAIASWVGGWRPAALTAIVGYAAIDFLILGPTGLLQGHGPRNLALPLAFAFTSGVLIALGEGMHRARRKRDELADLHHRLLHPMSTTGEDALRDTRVAGFWMVSYVLALVLLLIGGALTQWNVARLADHQASVIQTQLLFSELGQFLSTMQDAETGQRGYLLTGDEEYLDPYRAALPRIDDQLSRLDSLTARDPEQRARLVQVRSDTRAKLAELALTIATHQNGGRTRAMVIVRSDRGRALMDEIRAGVSEMEQAEHRHLDRGTAESKSSLRAVILWNIVEAALGVGMLALLFVLTRRNLEQRRVSAELLAGQHERLRVTLASIGDGVITTGRDARVTYLNSVAESLTGWSQADAIGQPLDTIFEIVNETTRVPVENPARRALREGVIVGLANHTVLLARDGTERAIDDSAAPILGSRGELIGCVLVFRDVGDRRRAEQKVHARLESARFLASIVESAGDGIISMSLDGVIQSWNSAAQRLYGYSAERAVGQHVSLILPEDRANEEDQIFSRIRAGERVEHFETVRKRADGTRVHVSLTISPIVDEDGRVVGVSKTARDITDRKSNEEVIYGLLKELKEGDQRKDNFLAMLAHELRGPLAPLRNTLEIMKRAEGSAQVLQQARGTMERQLGQLIRLVDDLLDVSRITRDRLELRREPVELASVVHQSVEATRPVAEASQHQIRLALPEEPVYVYADPVRLVQIFGNLLNNACKYTRPGGQVSLTMKHETGEVVVIVADTGMGIPQDKLDSIFEMFTQIDQTLDRAEGGLGIGLTLVKRLAEMHGGSVEAHSDGPGKGSRFVVRLPIYHPELGGPAREAPAPLGSVRRRILVVDDNVDSAESLALLLQMGGHEVHLAHDGLDAIQRAGELRPDVMLLDIGLPRLSGHDACRRIREHEWGRGILIVAMTGWGQEEDRQRAREAGFDYHITKPADFDALTQLIDGMPNSRNA